MNDYDIHIILSCLANSIHDIENYDKKADLGLLKDYKITYYKLKQFFLISNRNLKEGEDNQCGKI